MSRLEQTHRILLQENSELKKRQRDWMEKEQGLLKKIEELELQIKNLKRPDWKDFILGEEPVGDF